MKKSMGFCAIILIVLIMSCNLGILHAASNEEPATFKNVTYTLRSEVISVDDVFSGLEKNMKNVEELKQGSTPNNLPLRDKIQRTVFVDKNLLTKAISKAQIGSVIFDKNKRIFAKVSGEMSNSDDNTKKYFRLKRPKIHEVYESYKIPRQTVILTKGNISEYYNDTDKIMSRNTTIRTRGIDEWTLSNPNVCNLSFENDLLKGYSIDGVEMDVKLKGYLGIEMSLDSSYDLRGDYRFVLNTTELAKLNVEINASVNKEIYIPIWAINVDIPGGAVRGGVFLVAGMNGKLTLVFDAKQKLSTSAGVEGETWIVPTSFHPVFNYTNKVDVDTDFAGRIDGYIKAGASVGIEIADFDVAGAEAFIGFGVKCTAQTKTDIHGVQRDMFDAEIYGLLDVNASLCGHRFDLLHERPTLYHIYNREDLMGYKFDFKNACAYRKLISGFVQYDRGPAENKPIQITVQNSNGQKRLINATTNKDGYFVTHANFELFKSDNIKITKVGNDSLDNINQLGISPSLPFNGSISYADFFNDECMGQVTPALLKNPDTGQFEKINYNGDILITVSNINKDKVHSGIVKANSEGKFVLKYDFKPDQEVKANIIYNGFDIPIESVQTDVRLVGQRIIDNKQHKEYIEKNFFIASDFEKEYFSILNLRGSKSIPQVGNHISNYYNLAKLKFNTQAGKFYPTLEGQRMVELNFVTAGNSGSIASQAFQTEVSYINNLQLPNIPNITTLNPNIFNWTSNKQFKNVRITEKEPVKFRLETNFKRNDPRIPIGRSSLVKIKYEGKDIIVRDEHDDEGDEGGYGGPHITAGETNPFKLIMLHYRSHINPDPNVIPGHTTIPNPGRLTPQLNTHTTPGQMTQ